MIFFETNNPTLLLQSYKMLIDNGKVDTWTFDADGDFTHCVPQWNKKAWLRPKIQLNGLALYIIAPTSIVLTKAVYGLYHGRFIESVTTHLDVQFTRAEASSMPMPGDILPVTRAS